MSSNHHGNENGNQTNDTERMLKQVRALLKTDNYLNSPTDDTFLLKFLRSMQYDVEGTFRLVQKYFQLRIDNPDMYIKRYPSEHPTGFENNILNILPHRDQHGRRVVCYKPGGWLPERCSVLESYRAIQMGLEYAVRDEETQKNGVVVITDWKNFGWHQAKHCRPWNLKIGAHLLQECLPSRFVAFHIINQHYFFQMVFVIFNRFLTDEFRKKLFFHGKNYESLHQHVDRRILPVEYGGDQPNTDNSIFWRNICTCDDEFLENSKYGYISYL